jgi:A118 family predicted phage portal protein
MTVYEILTKFAERKSNDSRVLDFSRAMDKKEYDSQVEQWQNYYRGNVPDIHSYQKFNGEEVLTLHRYSMRLAKQIVKKWATMLFTEAFKVTLKNDTETDKFNSLARATGFRSKLNNATISGYALGTSVLLASADIEKVNGVVTGGQVKLDLIQYANIYPISYTQDNVLIVAFVRTEKTKDAEKFYISIHTVGETTTIENAIATVKNNSSDPEWDNKPLVEMSTPPFAWIKPNTLNDYSETLPFGQSIFADALAPIIDVDLAASGMRRDLEEGDQVTFIGRDLLMEKMSGEDGKTSRVFKNPKGQFFAIPQDSLNTGETKKMLFEQHTPKIRTQEYNEAIKDSVNWALMNSGLGRGTLDILPMATATQVIHTESEKMQNKSLHEQYLEGEIIKLVKALCELSTTIGNPIDASEVSITWEDSVIVDTAEQKRLAILEIDNGVLSKEEYRMKFYGETLEQAREKLAEITGNPDFADGDNFNMENENE